jgi:transposase
MQHAILGIDIAKVSFQVVLLEDAKEHPRSFPNNDKGFEQLQRWLRNRKVERVHACLEATGAYGEALATALHEAGHTVSIINPARIRGFAQSELVRSKTDGIDAGVIARFCKAHTPTAWLPPSPQVRTLQGLTRRLESLHEVYNQEQNRAEVPGTVAPVAASIAAMLGHLKEQIADLERQIHDHIKRHPDLRERTELLTSIPGLAEKTAARILSEVHAIERFACAKQLSTYAGLSPQLHQSGSSIRGRTRLSKKGNPQLRKALFMPALAALRWNPLIRRFAERLRAAGKTKMVIVGAVMRKLLHIAYGVLKSKRPFDPNFDTVRA